MRVYTHYFEIAGGLGCRWRTLLQLGDSWNVIGSVVMKNPGSANFKSRDPIVDANILKELKTFDMSSCENPWYEFNSDHTMRCVERLFNAFQKTHGLAQEGVVQIFNLFYLKGSDLNKAISEKNRIGDLVPSGIENEQQMVEYDLSCLVAPIYLGFSGVSKLPQYNPRARMFFDKAKELGMSYLLDEFEANKFIHPMYLMGVGSKSDECQRLLQSFLANSVGTF